METSATFIGNATVLLRLGAFTVLTDPNFLHRGQRAYLGYGLWSKRRTEPALDVGELPALDGVVLSHLHGDHFDRVARRGLERDLPVVTTRPAARRLRRWRFGGAVGLDEWQDVTWRRGGESLRITAVPARHGPAGLHLAMPTTIGTVLDWDGGAAGHRLRLYVTGDTRFAPRRLAAIPQRFGDIDAALVHLGGTRILGLLMTMDAREGVALCDLVRPGLVVPIHHDDYGVFRDPVSNFLARAGATGLGPRLRPVGRGETVGLRAAGLTAR